MTDYKYFVLQIAMVLSALLFASSVQGPNTVTEIWVSKPVFVIFLILIIKWHMETVLESALRNLGIYNFYTLTIKIFAFLLFCR